MSRSRLSVYVLLFSMLLINLSCSEDGKDELIPRDVDIELAEFVTTEQGIYGVITSVDDVGESNDVKPFEGFRVHVFPNEQKLTYIRHYD